MNLSTQIKLAISVVLMVAGVALAGVIWAPAAILIAVVGAILLPLPRRFADRRSNPDRHARRRD